MTKLSFYTTAIGVILATTIMLHIDAKAEAEKQRIAAEKQRIADKVYQAKTIYNRKVLPLEQEAHFICRKWTNSSCKSSEEMLQMARIYARYRALYKHSQFIYPNTKIDINKMIPEEHRQDYIHLEKYRRVTIDFWDNLHNERNIEALSLIRFPGSREKIQMSTFHWLLHMTNNRCAEKSDEPGGEPKVYDKVLLSLDERAQTEIKEFRKPCWQAFPAMQQHAFNNNLITVK